MLTCSKTYRDVPLSHRQPRHPGRCSRIHGHSWTITITFAADELDDNGFIVDFGELHYLADWIDENLDHATVVASDDPRLAELQALADSDLLKLHLVESASCEGIARYLFETFAPMVASQTSGRARVVSIELHEDSRNSALYRPDPTQQSSTETVSEEALARLSKGHDLGGEQPLGRDEAHAR